jgi:hypothetical protein
MKRMALVGLILGGRLVPGLAGTWVVVDTGQDVCYDNRAPVAGFATGRFSGQDAQFTGAQPSYRDNGDGTVSDLTTGLMWSKAVDPRKVNLAEGNRIAQAMTLGGHTDWRVPTIKELYSLIDFRGVTGAVEPEKMQVGSRVSAPPTAIPYLNTDFFDFLYGDGDAGERFIDSQWLTSTKYVATTMDGAETLFGVNFADGRIKGYPVKTPDPRRPEKKFYARYVRGTTGYGRNDLVDQGDGTVADRATGLIWARQDSGVPMTWEEALRYAENFSLAGHDDWRLPNAKELQSLVDYSRSPDTTDSPAIDKIFQTTSLTNEAGKKDWPFFWTSTTHVDGPDASPAVYVAFGRAIGMMHGKVMDVHGAGAQRSDPKTGRARIGHGPQGDAQRVKNFVRCVRGGSGLAAPVRSETDSSKYPLTVRVGGKAHQPAEMDFSPKPMGAPGGGWFVGRLDRDGDGKVSRQEFDGPPEHFARFDKNGDGFLGADEAPSGPPPGPPR